MSIEQFITPAELSSLKAFILGALTVLMSKGLKSDKPRCKEIKNIKLKETKDLP